MKPISLALAFDRCHLGDFRKKLAAALSAPSVRELTDVLVIFSITFLTYKAVADWGGMTVLQFISGTEVQKPSFLYFFGMALVLFSLRRIGDQRSERTKRVAAEISAQTM